MCDDKLGSEEGCTGVARGCELATLFHKKKPDAQLVVRLDTSASLGVAKLEAGVWVVPCDLVGSEEGKKARPMKVRVHPQTETLARSDAALADAVKTAAKQVMDALLWEWQARAPVRHDPRLLTARRVARMLHTHTGLVEFTAQRLCVSWSLCSTAKAVSEATGELKKKATKGLLSARVDSEQGADTQTLSVDFVDADFHRPLLRISLPGKYMLDGEANVEISTRRLRFSAVRSSPDDPCLPVTPPESVATAIAYEDGQNKNVMLSSSQSRVEELRRRLDESLAAFQKSTTQRETRPRGLHLVEQTDTETVVEVTKPGGRPRLERMRAAAAASSTPLAVICDGMPLPHDWASSPAESVDSGVSLSSPVSSPVTVKSSPFYQYSEESSNTARLMGMRQRSQSESGTPSWYNHGLKGILKKPSGGGVGGGKRAAGVARSVSECMAELDAVPDTTRAARLMRAMTLEEDMEEEEEETEEEEEGECAPIRKKRVSFSERLTEERRFCSNSCIFSASRQKKNKKTAERKARKRAESERSSDDVEKEKGGAVEQRKDSGFSEEEQGGGDVGVRVFEVGCPERGWMRMVRTQRSRANSQCE